MPKNKNSTEDLSQSPEYCALIEKFEALYIHARREEQEAEEQEALLNQANIDCVQDDSNRLFVKIQHASTAPLMIQPAKSNFPEKMPFVFLFDPTMSRASKPKKLKPESMDFTGIDDASLILLFNTFHNLSLELALEKFCLFAKNKDYNEDVFIQYLKVFSVTFQPISEEMVLKSLRIIHEYYLNLKSQFFIRLLKALEFDCSGSVKLALFRQVFQVNDLVRELIKTEEGYKAIYIEHTINDSGHQALIKRSIPVKGYYSMVIVDDLGERKIWIGKGHHYSIARGKSWVYFAGNIEFNDNSEVIRIDDHSGGYHGLDEENIVVRHKRKLELTVLLDEMGLPIEKFISDFVEPMPIVGSPEKLRRLSIF